jgi:hypothetical protein
VFGQPADVFSAGVLLWEAITGKPLFRNWPLDAIVTQLIGRKVPYPIPFGDALWGVPLADVAMRALSVDPGERWPHIGALGAQVENIARGHLASSDEIAALVAGFAAGRGSSVPPAPVVIPIVAPPPASAPAASAVTSLSPTASSIQAPPESQPAFSASSPIAADSPPPDPESRSTAPVEVAAAAPPPAVEPWEAPPPPPSHRIWLPDTGSMATERSAMVPAEVADSWSGIAPPSAPGMSRRAKMTVAVAVFASVATAGIVAYQAVERSPEARSTATVLAPKVAAANHPSTAQSPEAHKAPQGTSPASDSLGKPSESAAGTSAVPSSTGAAPSATATQAASLSRPAPKPVTRAAPTPAAPPAAVTAATPKAATPPPPAPPAAPAPTPAAKPKPAPKEDLFGL